MLVSKSFVHLFQEAHFLFEKDAFSTKNNEIEAHFLFEKAAFSTKISEIEAHFLFRRQSASRGLSGGSLFFGSERPATLYSFFFTFSFFRAHRTNDLTKKLEKIGPFECDELEKHCRVSATCYPTTVPTLHRSLISKFQPKIANIFFAIEY